MMRYTGWYGKSISVWRNEDIKLRCLIANVSAIELIKQMFYDSGNINDCVMYEAVDGSFITTVTEVNEIRTGDSNVYRIGIDTIYEGYYTEETELIIYITAH